MTDPTDQARDRLASSFGYQEVRPEDKSALVGDVFARVAARYDLMNDLMSVGRAPPVEGGHDRLAGAAPGLRLLDVAGGTGDIAFRVLDRLVRRRSRCRASSCATSIRPCSRSAATGRSTPTASTPIDWLCADAEALPLPDRSVDAYTIAFGIRNVTRIDRALAEARRVLVPGGRFLCLEFATVASPALRRAYDAYSFTVLPWLGERGRRRPGGLSLSGREHPALSRPGDLRAHDRAGRARARALSRSVRRHRGDAFGLAALGRPPCCATCGTSGG